MKRYQKEYVVGIYNANSYKLLFTGCKGGKKRQKLPMQIINQKKRRKY
ncbi:hypothetical protein JTS97_08865 [Clostridium botulinum]|nr:hypothetical protein [Clostridium botulinum]